MGKKKLSNTQPSCDFCFSKHGLEDLESLYPTLLKVAGCNELPLLDLSSIQMDLEQVLASVVERVICLKAESKGKGLPVNIISSLKYQKGSSEPESNQQCLSKSSLVVKANPDKPLTLIISQRSGPCPNSQSILPAISSGLSKVKPSVSPFGLRRSSRSSVEEAPEPNSPTSDKNQLSASYAIPNKFWELMEPYCAEITEANVSYLESLIRSYQHLESIYFHLPVLRQSESCKNETNEAPACKRLRRGSQIFQQATTDESSCSLNNCNSSMSSSQLLNVTKYLETELKKPVPESSMLNKISQSLLESCYQDDILSNFSGKLNFTTHQVTNDEFEDNHSESTDPSGSDHGTVSAEALHISRYNNNSNSSNAVINSQVTNYPSSGSTITNHDFLVDPHLLTSRASEPLKSLAKQLRVSSSYRVEKKIAQAIDELGLFPLSVLHPKVSPLVESKGDCNPHNLSSSALCNDAVSHSTKLIIRKNKITSSNPVKSGPLKHSEEVQDTLEKNHVFKKCRVNNDKPLSPLPEHHKNASCEPNPSDIAHSTELSLLPVKMENINPIVDDDNNNNNNNGRIKSTCYIKKLKRRNLKMSKSLCYRNKLRNTVNSNNTHNEILYNGITSSLNDSMELNKSDRIPNSHPDPNIPTVDNEYFSDLDNPPGKQDLHTDVSPRSRDSFTTQLSTENAKRLIYPTSPSKQVHHSLRYNRFSPNNLSGFHCNGDSNPLIGSLEDHEPVLVNGDLSLSEFHSEKLTENDRLCDKPSSNCNTFEGGCETAQVLDSNLHSSLSQINEQCTTPLQNSQLKFKMESNWTERTNHLTGKSSHEASPIIQHNDSKSPDCGINTMVQNHMLFSQDTPSTATTQHGSSAGDDIGWAIIQRQRELRLLCTANHRMLRRLVQAARRDMQRQEIQRRLAIADADVIEAYNKLESYRPHRKPPLKRDRDISWKALKERRKILKELEAFDAKSP
ncbi:ADA3-like [Schistosoma mansoni]|uniref:ADA3-like n=1 Tax=Schistosoma mansoni TaxID=6183 RepID=UPI0001A62392|nr:ADA3-like [Schistosoma mansoni]|eukprot:XP_018646867.1 ADA3-like [Schistosoma mansoni]